MKAPTIEGLMRRDPVTITPLDTLAAAQSLMQRVGVRQLPVVEKGELIGILSERDMRAHSGYLERTKVDAAMSERLITVSPKDSAARAARLLLDQKINAVPVVEDGRLVGIVSRSDLLHLLVEIVDAQQGKGS
ncbi:MAG TPA: CBS domain-containing protein [Candidatus Margulisiibacteriota bacterium]|nr:CBS domain-containing protein [Candidatus Margulisiibacteriota bacterium]